jgi:DNA-binding IclR family transcriptional regulator
VLAPRASQIAYALKLPRTAVLRRLQELVKDGYVERVGNAYRVTDKVFDSPAVIPTSPPARLGT